MSWTVSPATPVKTNIDKKKKKIWEFNKEDKYQKDIFFFLFPHL